MGFDFTPKQQRVIDARNKDLLVSAAAGSGKTAVLVERIIQMISDEKNPIDVDRLVVVTFTKAAAQEMKDRILRGIEEKCLQNPENEHLFRQQTYIHNAMITTIDSFCLGVVKEHFQEVSIDPGFRIADEGELKLLRKDVLDEMFEEYYEEAREEFCDFVEAYSGKHSDENIEDLVMKTFFFSMSYPWPEEWMEKCKNTYETDEKKILTEDWMSELTFYVDNLLENYIEQMSIAVEICQKAYGPSMYLDTISQEIEMIEKIFLEKDFLKRYQYFELLKFERLSTSRKGEIDIELREKAKSLRNGVKDGIKKLKESFYYKPPQELAEEINKARPQVYMLLELVGEFSKRYKKAKMDNAIVDFNDLEHMALEILVKKEGENIIPTNVAIELSEFYLEIMVDEYQDSNYLQEVILKAISGEKSGRPNMMCVGDVKQSIYKFRMAKPELFINKYEKYEENEEAIYQKITLDKNFRSREEIIQSVNVVFKNTMKKYLGGIEYDRKNELNFQGSFNTLPLGQSNKTEVILVEKAEKVSEELEGEAVAGKIKELITEGFQIQDKNTQKMRLIKYSDIVILMRSVKGRAEEFESALVSAGIPCYVENTEGYFDTMEVRTILNFLKVIDNPRQDIPLVSILKSEIGGFTLDELGKIKGKRKNKNFLDYLLQYAVQGEEKDLREKTENFLQQLDCFRRFAEVYSVYEVLSLIFQKTGYYYYVSSMPGGIKRKANLDLLLERALQYQKTSYKGVFNFIRYVDRMKKNEMDFSEASVSGEKDDVVRIMTIHKSKGLEFPVVFLSCMGRKLNSNDYSTGMILHSDLGIGAHIVDTLNRTKDTTIAREVLGKKVKLEGLGEELRVLYVALTRAKEKLILTGLIKDAEKEMDKWKIEHNFVSLTSAKNMLDWIMPVVLDSPLFHLKILSPEQLIYEKTEQLFYKEENIIQLLNLSERNQCESSIRNQIEEKIFFSYPMEQDTQLKPKMSVSEIKKMRMGETIEEFRADSIRVPEFVEQKDQVSGTEKGTAYHEVFERMDFSRKYTLSEIDEFLQLHGVEAMVSGKDILEFFQSSLGKRMAKAEERNMLFKEKQYVMGIPASEILKDYTGEEQILVQGIIDAYFEEDEEMVIVDYKTDKVSSEKELIDRYSSQLEFYEKALIKVTGKKVKEKIIYSTVLKKEVYI